MFHYSPPLRLTRLGRLCLSLPALLGLFFVLGKPAAAEARPLDLHVDMFTEGMSIPFTRLIGNEFNPGVAIGLEWRWLDRPSFAVFQTGYGSVFFHGLVERGLLAGTEFGLRGTASFGLAAEIALGVAYLHAFSGGPRYDKNESGSYIQVPDWGRPRFSPTFHLGLGYDFSRLGPVPMAVFIQ
ncbi:MAG: hypothetical protein E4H36_15710, partial [Spirochaetales bacterium]